MNFCLFITGCQYNYYDANTITHLLTKMGYIYNSSEQDADLIIALGCAVKQKPVDRLFGNIKKWKNFKNNPKLIILGCLLEKDKKIIAKRVDLITTSSQFKKDFIKYIHPLFQPQISSKKVSCNNSHDSYPMEAKDNTTYVPIMQGCNNFCTYCVVPYTRGREISRTKVAIIKEIKAAIKQGKKHIILLGQNVNSYNPNNDKNIAFADLLLMIDNLTGNFDFNFLTSNPYDFSNTIIETLPVLKKWEKILHLPIQSGDNIILKKMNRKYTVENYFDIVTNLRNMIPDIQITTDIIVGFPGETDEQFLHTYQVCQKIGFTKAFVSQYSLRNGTTASKFKQNNLPATIKARWVKINDLVNTRSN